MSVRDKLDRYYTPEDATRALFRALGPDSVSGCHAMEPCVGTGNISDVMREHFLTVFRNDVDRGVSADAYEDASSAEFWNRHSDWVITNPPFKLAPKIVPLAYDSAAVGVAMLLRLSYLEPCDDRGKWLEEHPPDLLLVLSRISFTGDGKSDNVTCAWMVWFKDRQKCRQSMTGVVVSKKPDQLKQPKQKRVKPGEIPWQQTDPVPQQPAKKDDDKQSSLW